MECNEFQSIVNQINDQIFVVVENSEIEIRKLLNFCELKWDDNCLNHHKNERAIKTASSIQARKPIYKTAVKSSDRYKDYLKNIKSIIESN